MKEKLIVDFNWLYNNRLFAFKDMATKSGVPTGGAYGVLKTITSMIDNGYSDISICLDGNPTERKLLYEGYKANREPNELRMRARYGNQIVFETLSYLGCKIYKDDNLEADDLIASLATDYAKKGIPCTIYSGDKDLCQLMTFPQVSVSCKIEKGKFIPRTSEEILEKVGCEPRLLRWLRPARGDSSDNIPSAVPRVQAKVILPIAEDIEDGAMLGLTLPESYHRAVEKHKDNLTKNAYEKFRNGITQYCVNFQLMDLLKYYHQPLEIKPLVFRQLDTSMIISMLDSLELRELKDWFLNKKMFGSYNLTNFK